MLLLLGVVLWGTSAVLAQNDRKIAEQKKVVADLERKIAEEERQLTKLRTGKKQPRRPYAVCPVKSNRAANCSTKPRSKAKRCAEN